MEVYFGGQIKQAYRGPLAAIVTETDGHWGSYISPLIPEKPGHDVPLSEDFLYLTGDCYPRVQGKSPIERVYIGVNHETAREISKKVSMRSILSLDDLDRFVVLPHFLSTRQKTVVSTFQR